MSPWLYLNGTEVQETDFGEANSFVYVITNLLDNRRYFGKKRLQFVRRKRVKGRSNRRIVRRPSDWKDYWGSSDELKSDVARLGSEAFKREIIRLCLSLSEASYYELKYQMDNDVLLHPDKFYNAYVGGRISRKQLGVKDNDKV
jgi:Kyanoviridae NAD synthetase